jgi:TolB-like protein
MKNCVKFLAGLALLAAAGCATSLNFQVQKFPALNTLGIKRIAVMPFSTADNSSLQRQAATLLRNESFSRIQALNHFTLINADEIERVRRARGNIENLADGLFSGQVLSVSVKDSSSKGSRKDKDGNMVEYIDYTREVEITFNYGFTRTKDGSMIGPLNKNYKTSVSVRDDQSKLASAETIVKDLIQQKIKELDRDIAPYTVTVSRNLMRETSKDKALKQRFKDANAAVKASNYRSAQNEFQNIYQDTGSFAAAYNVALLIEFQGDTEGALSFMQGVYNKTGSSKAYAEISRLQKVINDAGLLKSYQMNSQQDRVIALMVDTLPSRMPGNPRIAFMNNSQNYKELADEIINGIISGLVSKKITVIDRNNRAMLDMERSYQLSGNVSDEEMVSVGHEAGVNIIVLVSVTGAANSKRLSVRALDVERSTILYQSPQADEMNL